MAGIREFCVIVGRTEIFADTFVQQADHIKAWRYYWWTRGVDMRTNGRRYDLRGNPIDGGHW